MIFWIGAIVCFTITLIINKQTSTGKEDLVVPLIFGVQGGCFTYMVNNLFHVQSGTGASATLLILNLILMFWLIGVPWFVSLFVSAEPMQEMTLMGLIVWITVNVLGLLGVTGCFILLGIVAVLGILALIFGR
jgi:hypothetical protein